MAAIIRACQEGQVPGSVAVVVAPSEAAPALDVAREMGVPTRAISYDENFATNLLEALKGCDVLCLAGFMRLLPPEVLAAFPNRVLNIHPALLPKFGGKGMYGMHVHEAVIAAGETESGASVHVVTEKYDEGPVLVQLKCPIEPGETPETLAAKVLQLEHRAYAEALASLAKPVEKKEARPAKVNKDEELIDLQHPFFREVGVRFGKFCGWVLLTLLGPFRMINRHKIPKEGGLIILSNHQADVDPIAVQVACPRPIYFMAKSELFSMPILGPVIKMFRAFPVKRGAPDRAALRKAAATAKSGQVVCVFPEGQLSEDGKLQEFRAGSALVVKLAGVPVICCGVKNTNRIMPYGKVLPRPSFRMVSARWGDVHTFEPHASAEEITAWAEAEIRRLIDEPAPNK